MTNEPISPWPFVGVGILASLGFLYGASVLFLPWWAVTLLYVCWVPLMFTGARWFAVRPKGVMALAAAGVSLWLIALLAAVAAS